MLAKTAGVGVGVKGSKPAVDQYPTRERQAWLLVTEISINQNIF